MRIPPMSSMRGPTVIISIILFPRGRAPFGQHQESRPVLRISHNSAWLPLNVDYNQTRFEPRVTGILLTDLCRSSPKKTTCSLDFPKQQRTVRSRFHSLRRNVHQRRLQRPGGEQESWRHRIPMVGLTGFFVFCDLWFTL